MKSVIVFVFSLMFLYSFGQFKFKTGITYKEDSIFLSQNKLDKEILVKYLINEINNQRKLSNLSPVKLVSDSNKIKDCDEWNKELLKNMVLSHDTSYINDYQNNNITGENCISFIYARIDFQTDIYEYVTKDIMTRWMNSSGHKKNILCDKATQMVINFDFTQPKSSVGAITGISTLRFFK
jgi:uncharacterized protein YkwD